MNILSWILTLSLLVFCFIEAVALHRATVCRQQAWLRSTELITGATLTDQSRSQSSYLIDCQIVVSLNEESVSWRNLKTLKKNIVEVDLKGSL